MEPRIQYAQTKDGVSIAYWTLGEGLPLLLMYTGGFSHIQLEWEIPQLRRVYERLAQNLMLVRQHLKVYWMQLKQKIIRQNHLLLVPDHLIHQKQV